MSLAIAKRLLNVGSSPTVGLAGTTAMAAEQEPESDTAPGDEAVEDAMHLHKPKPVGAWGEFLSEIGVIVVGILIALALEQSVEWLHWRREIAETRQALGLEITYNVKAIEALDAQNTCLRQQLDTLGAWASGTAARPVGPVLLPLLYNLQTSTWDVANSGQVVAHFPLEMRVTYARLFSRFGNQRDAISDERNAWVQIVALANQAKPDPEELRRLREAVGVARIWDARRRFNSVNILRTGSPLGTAGPGPDTIAGVSEISASCSGSPKS